MKDYLVLLPIEQKHFKVGEEEWLATISQTPKPGATDIDRICYKIRFDRQDQDDQTRTLGLCTSDITLMTDTTGQQKEVIWEKIQLWLESGQRRGRIDHFG